MATLPDPALEGAPALVTDPHPKKPMASCRKVSLYRREVRVSPSQAALEILYGLATQLGEGQRDGAAYVGSTMMTVDLERAAHLVSESCDAATARRFAELAGKDDRMKGRARTIGVAAAERDAGAPLVEPAVDVRFRAAGHHLHIDVDVEGKLATARGQ